jgi:hypothetical protein
MSWHVGPPLFPTPLAIPIRPLLLPLSVGPVPVLLALEIVGSVAPLVKRQLTGGIEVGTALLLMFVLMR